MLRFTLFGFPILIHWIFWLNTALMGGALSANSPEQLRGLLGWMVAVFLSILIHELGHALTMRNYGDRRVSIALYAFGGLAQGSNMLTRKEDLIISAAGPGLQILFGLAVGWSITLWRVSSPWLHEMLDAFTVISLFWALLNLVPIVPLDGGRLCLAWLGPGKQRQALTISLVCAAAMAAISFERDLWLGLQNSVLRLLDIRAGTRVGGGMFTLIFFGMLAWNNWKQLRHEPQIPWMNAR
ncbi:MAG: site-2 protease family protein [Prosthecobacter sp.]|uniref:site-2 protease family protein n=1 Tax=Prosthecobacter sp. TaxID=1965333 RepID=UPI003902D2D4